MSIIDTLNEVGEDLNNYKDRFLEIFTNPRLRIITVFVFLLFFSISLYIYFKYIQPKLNLSYVDNKEFVSKEADKLVVIWFYTDWCPFCKSTYSEWKSFKNDVENGNFDTPIEFREINCDKDENFANKYNIEEYPSIRIIYKEEVYIYDAKPNRINLMEFLKGSLPKSIINTNDLENDAEIAILGHD